MRLHSLKLSAGILLLGAAFSAYAEKLVVPMTMFSAPGQESSIGSVTLEDSDKGLSITPDLHGLPPGLHGFHVHEKPSCENNFMAAGGHLDPAGAHQHLGPCDSKGELGDLPVLLVDSSGLANTPILAPRLTLEAVQNHALMIHADGDNYSDTPEKLGGGHARIACGVIPGIVSAGS